MKAQLEEAEAGRRTLTAIGTTIVLSAIIFLPIKKTTQMLVHTAAPLLLCSQTAGRVWGE